MRLLILGICFSLICEQAFAQVEDIGVEYVPIYTQTADNTLGPLSGESFGFYLNTTGTNDLSAVTVTTPDSSNVSLVQGQYGNPGTFWTQQTNQSSATTYNGTYTFQTTGNNIASQTLSFTASGSLPTLPELAGTSIENLNAANGSAPVDLSLTYYSGSEGLNWSLFNTGTRAFVDSAPITGLNFTLPASDIIAGQSYELLLVATDSQNQLIDSSVAAIISYDPNTIINFGETVPEPSTLGLLLVAGAIFIPVLWKARSRAAKIA